MSDLLSINAEEAERRMRSRRMDDSERVSMEAELLAMMRLVIAKQDAISKKQDAADTKLSAHMVEETQEISTSIAAELSRLMMAAFPGGDPGGHKAAHLAWIKKEEEKAEFWRTMRKELAKWGLIALVTWAGVALWNAFLSGPHK